MNVTRTLAVQTLLDHTIANVKMGMPEMEERAKVKKNVDHTTNALLLLLYVTLDRNSFKQPRGKNVCASVYLNHELSTHKDTANALLFLFHDTLP